MTPNIFFFSFGGGAVGDLFIPVILLAHVNQETQYHPYAAFLKKKRLYKEGKVLELIFFLLQIQ